MQVVRCEFVELEALYGTALDTDKDFVELRTRLEKYLKGPTVALHKWKSSKWKLMLYGTLVTYLKELVRIKDSAEQRDSLRAVKRWYWTKVSSLLPEDSSQTSPPRRSCVGAISLQSKSKSVRPIESWSQSPAKSRPVPKLPLPAKLDLSAIDGLTRNTLNTITLSPEAIPPLDVYMKQKRIEREHLRTALRTSALRSGLTERSGQFSRSPLNRTFTDNSDVPTPRAAFSRSLQRFSKTKVTTDRELLDGCAFPKLCAHDSQLNWEVKMLEVGESKRKLAHANTPCSFSRLQAGLMKPRLLDSQYLTPSSLPSGGERLTFNPFSALPKRR